MPFAPMCGRRRGARIRNHRREPLRRPFLTITAACAPNGARAFLPWAFLRPRGRRACATRQPLSPILRRFRYFTELPVLINTSFNVPRAIVNRRRSAYLPLDGVSISS